MALLSFKILKIIEDFKYFLLFACVLLLELDDCDGEHALLAIAGPVLGLQVRE